LKIHIEIVTGFLGAGKTSFINSLLSESQVEGERVLVFQLEHGEKKIIQSSNKNFSIIVQAINQVHELKEQMIYAIKEYNPNRIIIEYNGTVNLNDLLDILNERIYKECCKITTIFFVADGNNLRQYIENIGSFMIPFIQNAHMIVVNNTGICKKEVLEESMRKIKNINPKAYILKVDNKYILRSILREAKVLDNGYIKKLRIKLINHKKDY
jgi:G3E family GTPase